MPNIHDWFLLILASVAYFSFLFVSILSLIGTLWIEERIPNVVAICLAIFSVALLGLAYADGGPAILLLFTVTSMCWIIIAAHQSLAGDYK